MDINNTDGKFLSFAGKYLTDFEKQLDKDLEWDLRITGDDAIELIEEYRQLFPVDFDGFIFHEYFHDEATNLLLLWKRIIRKKTKKSLTFRDLWDGAKRGRILK